MEDIVTRFGALVQQVCGKDPLLARRLLCLGYRAKKLQLTAAPGRHTTRAAQMAAVQTMASMIAPLAHPERAAMVSLFLPCEPLQVAGLYPYSCEGFGCFLSGTQAEQTFLRYAEGEGLPETFCSYHKIFIGAAEKGLMPKPRFVLNTTLACDANLLTFRRMAEYFQVPQFVVDVPYQPDEAGVRYVADQLRALVRFVERQTGRPIPEDRLSQAVARSQRSMDQFDRYMTLRRDRQILGELTGEMFSVFALHTLLGTPETEAYTARCLMEASKAPPAAGVRLLWMHTTPFWVEPLRKVTDFNPGVQVVACDMCFEGLVQADPARPYDAMARRVVYSAFNGPVSRRIQRGIEVARQVRADGAVWFCHWGCKHTLGGAQLAKEQFEAAGLPCLVLDGDGCDRSHGGEGQLATRMDAFVELLRAERGEGV
ncbi:2-hydroxyacyl-CoA dehydratase subunit D [uncultured Flavonifractor sp.]|uniref:2-hydroxyacyl-CoA dehydratase subunit D n=1 Tax=uncultured Flavonifractor sp. TaxID=1193534 RepID=UPI00261ADACC|nr:2-hydroxyacyl-CoA dehydratase family protein [uncultured Flavonifractor sp.]